VTVRKRKRNERAAAAAVEGRSAAQERSAGADPGTVLRIQITCFWGLPDPDPLVRGVDPDPDQDWDPSIIMQK
jgi:hypothetical protein